MAGSLYIIWPWKKTDHLENTIGEAIDKNGNLVTDLCTDGVVTGYHRIIPPFSSDLLWQIVLILTGVGLVLFMDLAKEDPQ